MEERFQKPVSFLVFLRFVEEMMKEYKVTVQFRPNRKALDSVPSENAKGEYLLKKAHFLICDPPSPSFF